MLTNTAHADHEPTFKTGTGFANMMFVNNKDGGAGAVAEIDENCHTYEPMSSGL